mmetsp:Transcript_38102/g.44363  ORF Transcript_38102/g.44363 Transcript_38102/m.44363 type:complete len:206 (+) Transcript_38102:1991-2608(+)
MNSKSLFTTVFKNFQCALRKRGYWPTTYIMFEATTALLSFPLLCSQRPNKSLITVTKNRFSSSSDMAPDIEPIAQHNVFRFCQLHCEPSTWRVNLASIILSVSSQFKCVKNTNVSRIVLYWAITSVSFVVSRTMSPFSSSTIRTSSGFAIRLIITCRTPVNTGLYMKLRLLPLDPLFAAPPLPRTRGLDDGSPAVPSFGNFAFLP